ncbi:MAG: hypothetical protein H0T76_25530 [Nannocystis sp.]|nr:hypothetical protein [Nannocystis sp.]MBA3549855.1 hypothetical protein [Nannocystis sp.]
MRAAAISLVLMMACTDRATIDSDASTGTTAPGTTGEPTGPTTGELDNPAGFCQPQAQDPAACPADYICCSDDPATVQGRLPNYYNQQVNEQYGVPIFSAMNNVLSYSGQCVDVGEFPSPLASGCPVPCNPTWSASQQDIICGAGTACCSFQLVDPNKDCVLDPDTSRWRSVRGTDIPALTKWGATHTTNQDPEGKSCTLFATGGVDPDPMVLADCFKQLTVADQRGFCYASCPCQEDLCDMKNVGWVPRCS